MQATCKTENSKLTQLSNIQGLQSWERRSRNKISLLFKNNVTCQNMGLIWFVVTLCHIRRYSIEIDLPFGIILSIEV